MSAIKEIPFNLLPFSARERLTRMLTAESDPYVVRWWRGHRGGAIAVGIFCAIAFIASAYVMIWLADEDTHKEPYFDREIYLLLAGLLFVFFTTLVGLLYRLVWKPPPYKWGVAFLGHGYAVHVGRYDVSILPLSGMGVPTLTTVRRNGVYVHTRLNFAVGGRLVQDQSFTYTFGSQEDAEKALAQVRGALRVFDTALASRDERLLREMDPFWECTLTGQWTSPHTQAQGPLVPAPSKALRWARWLVPLALAIGMSASYFIGLTVMCELNPKCDTRERLRARYR